MGEEVVLGGKKNTESGEKDPYLTDKCYFLFQHTAMNQ